MRLLLKFHGRNFFSFRIYKRKQYKLVKPSRSIYIAIKVIQIKDKFNLIGKKIPEFSLPNSRGETVSISDLEGKKFVLIVLFRGIQ